MDSWKISTIICLKYSTCTRYIDIITMLGIGTYYKFVRAMWAFHSELVDFSSMEIIYPCFDRIKSYTFSNHILTILTSYMEWCLISNFITSNSFTLNYFKWFLLLKLAFFRRDLLWVVVFWIVEIIGTSGSESAHCLGE